MNNLPIKDLILGSSVQFNTDKVLNELKPEKLVVNASLNKKQTQNIIRMASVLNIPVYNISEEGFLKSEQ